MAKRTYNRRGRQTAKTPIRNDGRGRQQRIKAAQVARDTGSKDRVTRGRGVSRTATGAPRGAQGPRTAPVQGPSRAVKGLIGSRNTPATKTTSGPPKSNTPKTPGRFVDKPQVKANVKALQSSLPAKVLTAGNKVAMALTLAQAAKQLLDKKPKAKSTPVKKTPGMSKGAVKKAKADAKETNRQSAAKSFDRAFAAARRAGKKEFTWRGKRYNTKLKK